MTGFVFESAVVIPVWAVVALLSALAPEISPVPFLLTTYVLPRRRPPGALEDPGPWRTAYLVQAGALGLAALMLAGGGTALAWALALPVAAHGALAGVGGICLACRLHHRRPRR